MAENAMRPPRVTAGGTAIKFKMEAKTKTAPRCNQSSRGGWVYPPKQQCETNIGKKTQQ
jgi:hypothetical protein